MLDKLKKLGKKAKGAISSATVLVGDLNGDGKVDAEDARVAAEWAKKQATCIGDEASKLGKAAIRSDLAKDAAAGAAVGAVVAVPLPVIGPLAGAAIGAGVGVYKNLNQKGQPAASTTRESSQTNDAHAELLKLDDLRQKGIISDAEFETEKKKILDART
ncbi:MAG: SHOCT domain-containing protein [Candidatus Desulfobacillus denitrificans]